MTAADAGVAGGRADELPALVPHAHRAARRQGARHRRPDRHRRRRRDHRRPRHRDLGSGHRTRGRRRPPASARACTTRPRCCCPTAACCSPAAARSATRRTRRAARSTRRPTCSRAARPTITAAPEASCTTARRSRVDTPDAAAIRSVALVRMGSVTHNFDMDQRYMTLSDVRRSGERASVDGPANANMAPPGCYMVFLSTERRAVGGPDRQGRARRPTPRRRRRPAR